MIVSSKAQSFKNISGYVLGTYNGSMPLDTKIDITGFGYIRGKWVTIVDTSKSPLTLAEIRVYGAKQGLGK